MAPTSTAGKPRLVLEVAKAAVALFVALLLVVLAVASVAIPIRGLVVGYVAGIAWIGALLATLAAIIAWLLQSRAAKGRLDLGFMQLSFQAARIFVIVLILGTILALVRTSGPEDPVFGTVYLGVLGLGFWGFVFCVLSYYYYGGQDRAHQLLLRMFSATRI